MVDKEFAMAFEGPPARSGLPCPNVIRDGIEPLQHQANGRFYDSKRAMERANKDAGCECVGNESPGTPSPGRPDFTPDEIGAAYKKVAAGYKPATQTEQLSKDIESGFL